MVVVWWAGITTTPTNVWISRLYSIISSVLEGIIFQSIQAGDEQFQSGIYIA